jgi:hypothetical protein
MPIVAVIDQVLDWTTLLEHSDRRSSLMANILTDGVRRLPV